MEQNSDEKITRETLQSALKVLDDFLKARGVNSGVDFVSGENAKLQIMVGDKDFFISLNAGSIAECAHRVLNVKNIDGEILGNVRIVKDFLVQNKSEMSKGVALKVERLEARLALPEKSSDQNYFKRLARRGDARRRQREADELNALDDYVLERPYTPANVEEVSAGVVSAAAEQEQVQEVVAQSGQAQAVHVKEIGSDSYRGVQRMFADENGTWVDNENSKKKNRSSPNKPR